jgi:hypothetical protein
MVEYKIVLNDDQNTGIAKITAVEAVLQIVK